MLMFFLLFLIRFLLGSGIDQWRSVEFQNSEEGLLRHLHIADLFHTLLTAFLLLQQLALTRHVATVALGGHILANLLDGLAGNDFRSDSSLNGNIELLARNEFLQFLAHAATQCNCIVLMRKRRQGIDGFSVEQNIELRQLRRAERVDVVVERSIAFRDALQLIVEVDDYLAQRQVEVQFDAVAARWR